MPSSGATTSGRLLCLDDNSLHTILSKLAPVPDRFHVAACCKRLRRLAADTRLDLYVAADNGAPPRDLPPGWRFATLQSAVDNSRPGDTIRVCPGEHLTEGVSIHHPLQLLGEPGSVLRCRQQQAESALDVHSNVRLDGLTIHASRSACVRQHSGCLAISNCRLECNPQRFDHLYCALVTLVRAQHVGPCASGGAELSVEATVIAGSLRAVRCVGDGALRDVRVAYEGSQKMFWFAVAQQPPSSVPCPLAAGLQGQGCVIEELGSGQADDVSLQRSLERKRQRQFEYGSSVRQRCA